MEKDMRENGQAQPSEPAHRWGDSMFRLMIEKLPAAAYTCDADGLVIYFNRRAVELWGPKRNDPLDRY